MILHAAPCASAHSAVAGNAAVRTAEQTKKALGASPEQDMILAGDGRNDPVPMPAPRPTPSPNPPTPLPTPPVPPPFPKPDGQLTETF